MQTNSDPSTGIIIKSDRSGRVRYTDEFKREVLAAYESSSLSGPDFARQCGVKYPTLTAWVSSRRRGKQPAADRVDQDPPRRNADRRGPNRMDAIALAPMTKMREVLC